MAAGFRRPASHRASRAGMGAQAFDARQLTFANSSIPLEKRSHRAAIAFLASDYASFITGQGKRSKISEDGSTSSGTTCWPRFKPKSKGKAPARKGKGNEQDHHRCPRPQEHQGGGRARSRTSCLHRGHVALVAQERQHQQIADQGYCHRAEGWRAMVRARRGRQRMRVGQVLAWEPPVRLRLANGAMMSLVGRWMR